MKVMGKKIPKGNSILFISFTAISLCLLMIVSAVRTDKNTSLSQRGLYSGNQRNFAIVCSEDEKQWENVIPNLVEDHNNFAIYTSIADPELVIRGICVNGKIEVPPMISGKYFDYKSSWTNEPKAVIGKEEEKNTVKENGKMYYDYCGVKFEVIGVMGTKGQSRLNNIILFDFKSAVGLKGINSEYELDAKSNKKVVNIGSDMAELFEYPTEVRIVLEEGMSKSLVAKLFSSEVIMELMYVMILISFSLSTVLVTFIWLRFRKKLFYVWALCGYKGSSVCLEISKRFFACAFAGFVCGLIMMLLISSFVPDISINIGDVLKAFGITVGLGAVILYACYFLKNYQIGHLRITE